MFFPSRKLKLIQYLITILELRVALMFAVDFEDNDQLADEITTLAGQINAANYRFLKLLAEFDRREAWEGAGIR